MGRPSTKVKLIGKVINGYEILDILSYTHASTRCVKCGTTANKNIYEVEKNRARCKGCNPTNESLYLDDVKDMVLDDRPYPEIADSLGCSVAVVKAIVATLRKKGVLDDEGRDYQYTFKEIAEMLNITESQAKNAYNGGLKKLKCDDGFIKYLKL